MTTITAEELLYVLEGWQSHDDWNINTYPYPSIVAELLEDLHAGDNPRALRLMGKARGWKARALAVYAPHHAIREWAGRS